MFRPSSTLKPVIYDVNPEEYHAPQKAARGTPEFVMSRSELEKFNICASKWKRNGYVQPETQALVWGGLMDVVVLTPDILESAYVTYPETYKKVMMQCPDCGGVADSKKCKACNKPRIQSEVEMAWDLHSSTCRKWALDRRAEGKIPIKAEMMSDAWAANARLKEDEEIMAILECSKKQVQLNLEWHCEDTGIVVPWKMLLDIVPEPSSEFGNTIYDFKTSRNLDRRKWKLQVFNDNLHLQAALYLAGINAATGLQYSNFGHIISESEPPWEPTVRPLDAEWMAMATVDYKIGMRRYCECIVTGKWPGYDRDAVRPDIWMAWAGSEYD